VPLFASDGTFYLPDFTVEWRGRKFFWEHLGMLDKPEYKKKWEQKKQWYSKHFPDCLLVTMESPKLSKTAQKLIEDRRSRFRRRVWYCLQKPIYVLSFHPSSR